MKFSISICFYFQDVFNEGAVGVEVQNVVEGLHVEASCLPYFVNIPNIPNAMGSPPRRGASWISTNIMPSNDRIWASKSLRLFESGIDVEGNIKFNFVVTGMTRTLLALFFQNT